MHDLFYNILHSVDSYEILGMHLHVRYLKPCYDKASLWKPCQTPSAALFSIKFVGPHRAVISAGSETVMQTHIMCDVHNVGELQSSIRVTIFNVLYQCPA